jgi:hypothetical protein
MRDHQVIIPAMATLEPGRYSWLWVVQRCPYCGRRHEHYAGPLDQDPDVYLGQTVLAKCSMVDQREYVPERPAVQGEYVLEIASMH